MNLAVSMPWSFRHSVVYYNHTSTALAGRIASALFLSPFFFSFFYLFIFLFAAPAVIVSSRLGMLLFII